MWYVCIYIQFSYTGNTFISNFPRNPAIQPSPYPVWYHVIWCGFKTPHYSDVIMGAMASQITSLAIVSSSVYLAQSKENIKAPRQWPLCGEFTGEFLAQMASNAENVSIWWRHQVFIPILRTAKNSGYVGAYKSLTKYQWPLLLTWFNFNLSMDK